jgi:hypothetical protein
MTQHDTPDSTPVITTAQAAALYAFVRKHLDSELIENAQLFMQHNPGVPFTVLMTAREIVDMATLLSAIDSTPTASGNKYRVVEIQECAEIRFQIVDNENNPVAARTFKSESAAQKMINNWFGKGFKP